MLFGHYVSLAQTNNALRFAKIDILSWDQFDTTLVPFSLLIFWNENIKTTRTIDAAKIDRFSSHQNHLRLIKFWM